MIMTKEELRQLSDQTFYDNNVGGITPPPHRDFNDALIDTLPELATNDPAYPPGIVRGGMGSGQVRVEADGTMTIPLATNTTPGIINSSTVTGQVSVDNDGTMKLNGGTNAPYYTYVVDSEDAWEQLVNKAAGNDYTSILIKKGDWILKQYMYIPETTKVVKGEPGSRIIVDIPIGDIGWNAISAGGDIAKLTVYNCCNLYDITLHLKNVGSLVGLLFGFGYVYNLIITQEGTITAMPGQLILSCLHVINPKIELIKLPFYQDQSSILIFSNVDSVEGAYIDIDANMTTWAGQGKSITFINARRVIRCVVKAKILGVATVTGISGGTDVVANYVSIASSTGAKAYSNCKGMRYNTVQEVKEYNVTSYPSCYASVVSSGLYSTSAANNASGGWNKTRAWDDI